MSKLNGKPSTYDHAEDARRMWVRAVEQMAENEKLKERVEFLERKIACEAFAGWTVH